MNREFSFFEIKHFLEQQGMLLEKINYGYKGYRYQKVYQYRIVQVNSGEILCEKITMSAIESWLKKIGVAKE